MRSDKWNNLSGTPSHFGLIGISGWPGRWLISTYSLNWFKFPPKKKIHPAKEFSEKRRNNLYLHLNWPHPPASWEPQPAALNESVRKVQQPPSVGRTGKRAVLEDERKQKETQQSISLFNDFSMTVLPWSKEAPRRMMDAKPLKDNRRRLRHRRRRLSLCANGRTVEHPIMKNARAEKWSPVRLDDS